LGLAVRGFLVVTTLGVTFAEGKLVLPERVARYVAEIVGVDDPEVTSRRRHPLPTKYAAADERRGAIA
jgi:hypothetical protein